MNFIFYMYILHIICSIPKNSPKKKKGIITEEKFEKLKKDASVKISEEEEALKLCKEKIKEQLKVH